MTRRLRKDVPIVHQNGRPPDSGEVTAHPRRMSGLQRHLCTGSYKKQKPWQKTVEKEKKSQGHKQEPAFGKRSADSAAERKVAQPRLQPQHRKTFTHKQLHERRLLFRERKTDDSSEGF